MCISCSNRWASHLYPCLSARSTVKMLQVFPLFIYSTVGRHESLECVLARLTSLQDQEVTSLFAGLLRLIYLHRNRSVTIPTDIYRSIGKTDLSRQLAIVSLGLVRFIRALWRIKAPWPWPAVTRQETRNSGRNIDPLRNAGEELRPARSDQCNVLDPVRQNDCVKHSCSVCACCSHCAYTPCLED